jgi:hypothetical protein
MKNNSLLSKEVLLFLRAVPEQTLVLKIISRFSLSLGYILLFREKRY